MAKRAKAVSTSEELKAHFDKRWQAFTPTQRAEARRLIAAAKRANKKVEAATERQEQASAEQDEVYYKLAKLVGVRADDLYTLDERLDEDEEDDDED